MEVEEKVGFPVWGEWNKMRLPCDTYIFIPDIATSVRSYLFPNESKIAFQYGVMVVREHVCVP